MRTTELLCSALCVVLAVSCQVPTALGKPGSLTLVLPGKAAGRAASTTGEGDTFRIELTLNGAVLPLPGTGGTAYLEVPMAAGQTVTIGDLSPGTGYGLLVSSGQLGTGGGFFETHYVGASAGFAITPGANTAVSVTLAATPFGIVEDTAGSQHLAASGEDASLYFLNGGILYNSGGQDPTVAAHWTAMFNPTGSPVPVSQAVGGAVVNSLQVVPGHIF